MKRLLLSLLCAVFAMGIATAKDVKKDEKKVTKTYYVESMHCKNCVKKIEKNIAFEKGVTDLKCDLDKQTVTVTYRTDKTSEEKIIEAFKKIDKPAVPVKDEKK